ncbi:hypothetical protein [Enterovirga sp.]|jgi:hypothetical protein|uniref:hypothetical protein n=1 Tax=Enterovirga sp. TaxID=2026350 RepID=UPI00260E5BE5|nr:hypothetical protein [Enterovirga sp.]MDB5589688.1 conserved rane protein of unknown function [Enterovirga sp.]
MISDRVLDLAVAQDLIRPGQAEALRSLARQEEPARPEPPDAERLRMVNGFADIFVTIGLLLFLGAATFLAGARLAEGWTAAVVALCAWGLAEFFTRRRRMALPSIVLVASFVLAVFVAVSSLAGGESAGDLPSLGWIDLVLRTGPEPLTAAAAAAAAAGAAALHYGRFRVPIAVAAGFGAAGLSLTVLLSVLAPSLAERLANPLLLLLGLVAFAAAMRFDLADPERRTRCTDIAFWLHLLAAPLIVHSLFSAIGVSRGVLPPAAAVLVLAIFCGLAAVAILVDRRAILVAGLVYAGVAFSSLARSAGLPDTVPVTLLALGAFILLLSAGWTPLRARLLGAMPAGLVARLARPLSP